METKRKKIGLLYILASAVFFSLGGVLIKKITWSSITINGARNLIAFIVMSIYLKKINHKIVINKAVIFGAVCNFLMNLTFVVATKLTSAADAIVLQFTAPLFLIVYLWIFLKKRPDKNAIAASLLVFSGILCFFFDKISLDGQIGNLIAILSGAFYGVIFMLKKIKGTDFESSVLISQAASFLIFIPWYFKETDFSSDNFIMIIILGAVQMGVAYICLAKGLDRVTPVTAALTSTIEPILNPLWVALFYGEFITPIAIVGAAIVILSSTFYNVISSVE